MGYFVSVWAVLLVLTNGPVFLISKNVLNRTGRWEDLAVWPFFAFASFISILLAVLTLRKSLLGTALSVVGTASVASYTLTACLSSLWSVHPGYTLWRSCVYVGLATLAAVIAQLQKQDICNVMVALACSAVVSSILLVIIEPSWGVDINGNWRGVYTNRNSLAPLAALGIIAGVYTLITQTAPQLASHGTPRTATRIARHIAHGQQAGINTENLRTHFGTVCSVSVLRYSWHLL